VGHVGRNENPSVKAILGKARGEEKGEGKKKKDIENNTTRD
jgi:hypothetical protein